MLAHINKVTGGEIAPNLARMVADESKASIEWLARQGVPFKPQGGEHGKFTIDPRGPSQPGRAFNRAAAPDLAMRNLHFRFIQQGGTIYYGARAQSLARSGDGKRWTVSAAGAAGDLQLEAQAVVIADGGFQANPELVDRYLWPQASRGSLRALLTATGDGLTMAQEHGAYVAGVGRGGLWAHPPPQRGLRREFPPLSDVRRAVLEGPRRRQSRCALRARGRRRSRPHGQDAGIGRSPPGTGSSSTSRCGPDRPRVVAPTMPASIPPSKSAAAESSAGARWRS